MKSGHRAARDGDEDERKQFAGEDRPAAVREGVSAGICKRGMHQDDPQRQQRTTPSFTNVLR